MRNLFIGILVGLVLSITGVAFAQTFMGETATFPIIINGKTFESDNPTIVVNGSTYLPLKDIGNAIGINVIWNSELGRVEIGEENKSNLISFSNTVSKTTYGMTTVIGEIKNNDIIKHSISLTVTFYDNDGKIMGTGTGFVSDLSPSDTKTFEIASMEDYSTSNSYKVQINKLYWYILHKNYYKWSQCIICTSSILR